MFRAKTHPTEDAVCVLNAGAGSNRAAKQRNTLDGLFRQHGKTVQIVLARSGQAIVREARAAVERKVPLIIAAGGDGTVSAVACMVQGTEAALGVLPLGTLNHFAKDLKIPLDLAGAVATLFSGAVAHVDVGEVNGQIFVNNSSLGLYPGVVLLRDTLQKRGYRKWPAFARAIVYALRHVSPLSVRLGAGDTADQVADTAFLFIGNNAYEVAAPHAGERRTLNEGKLWAYYAPRARRWKLVFLALRAVLGHRRPAELAVVSANEFWIRSSHSRVRIANDGEVINLTPPLHYRSIPGALRVMVPAVKESPAP